MATKIKRPDTAFSTSRRQQRAPRKKEESFLDFLRSLPCIVTGGPAEAAHVRYSSIPHGKRETGAGERPDDRWAVPLSPDEHRLGNDSQHAMSERAYWRSRGIDPLIIAALLYSAYQAGDREGAEHVCYGARNLHLWIGGK